MAKELTQIIDRELPNGWHETIVVAQDSDTGESVSERTEWYNDSDRGTRVDYIIEEVLK